MGRFPIYIAVPFHGFQMNNLVLFSWSFYIFNCFMLHLWFCQYILD